MVVAAAISALVMGSACGLNGDGDRVVAAYDPLNDGTGLTGTYFDNEDLTAPKVTRIDPIVDYDWGSNSPDPAIAPDTFSVRWTGQVYAPATSTYTFTVRSDEGARLRVNGQQIIDQASGRISKNKTGKIELTGGRRYDIALEYFDHAGSAYVELKWKYSGITTQIIPTGFLYPTACVASCTGKTCGDDGCGGSCGTCGAGMSCDSSNQCVGPSACVPACSGKSCGDDGCGGTCGTCTLGKSCDAAGQCVSPTCVPACSGKACGPDGCGGSCGTCVSGQTCNTSGLCVAPACVPACSGKSCGPDGCGGSCGSCASGQTCSTSGACVSACTPSCSGKVCGSDGCGGSCGSCATGSTCGATGQCVASPAPSTPKPFHFAAEITGSNPTPWADNLITKLGFNGFGFWGPFSTTTQSWVNGKPLSQIAWMPAANRDMSSYLYTYDPAKITAHENVMRTLTNASSDPTKIYWDGMPEWDQGGGNWSVGRPAVTSSISRQQNYENFKNYYLNTLGLANTLGKGRATRGYNFAAVSDYPWTAHWAMEWGADLVMGERIIDELSGIAPGNSFYRGAAKQFGRAWGNDMSTWRYWTSSPTEYNSAGQLTGGWSSSWFKRHLYASYMGGANVIHMEPATYFLGSGALNPLGTVVKDFANFALTRHPNRPPEHVPFALIMDKYSGFDPKFGEYIQGNGTWYSKIPYSTGDYMMNHVFRMAYPEHNMHGKLVPGGPTSVADYKARLANGQDPRPWEPMSKSHWGDVFDVLNNTTTAAGLANYKIAMLTTDAQVDATLRSQLTQFVQNGGVLILNAAQVTSADTALTGVALAGSTAQSTSSQWVADGSTTTEPTFNYAKVTLQGATVVAKTSAGDPLVTRFNVGAGQVYLTTPTMLMDAGRTQILNVGQKLIGSLLDTVAPVKVTGPDVLYHINSDAKTTTVTVINGGTTTWSGTLSFPAPSTTFTTKEWTSDTAVANTVSSGKVNVSASVPPYEVRVYALER